MLVRPLVTCPMRGLGLSRIDYHYEAERLLADPASLNSLASYVRDFAINMCESDDICEDGLACVLTLVALAELVADGRLILKQ